MQQRHLMIYAAHVGGAGPAHFTELISVALLGSATTRRWSASVLGTPTTDFGTVVRWPDTSFTALRSTAQTDDREMMYQNANPEAFAQLTARGSRPFDLLYLPSPWRNIPLGNAGDIPAPVVCSIHNLEFERADYGVLTDQHRREAAKLASLGSAFVFSSSTLKQEAAARYGIPADRAHVIRQAHSQPPQVDAEAVRRKYHLPAQFAFTLRWSLPRKNGRALIEALALQKDGQGIALPVVAAGLPFDDVLPSNVQQQRYREDCMALAQSAGLNDAGFRDLGVVDREDIPRLIAAASVVVCPSFSEAGLSYLLLNAMAQGTPVLYSRIPCFEEQLGSDNGFGLSFDPHDPAELAAALREVVAQPEAAQRRAAAAQTAFSTRTQHDVAQEYWALFDQLAASPWRTRPHQRTRPMVGREERVAWLINHTTLRDAELPILRGLGLEVYTSKDLPKGKEWRTASVDFSEDEHSTLPGWVLDRLNAHNFYEDGIQDEIAELLNGYFGTVITSVFFPPMRDSLRNFKGRILLRVFGREHPHNYSDILDHIGVCWRAWRVQHRFWFAPCYESIPEIEDKLLRDRTVLLPLGLPDRALRMENTNAWTGTDRRVMFLCPSINRTPNYYGRFYREFKQHLGHLPHIIPGQQPVPVDDPAVTGFASDDQMRAWFRELQVMFYHSREPRHLHYHPLEAVACGMPLIYMRGGLVEALMGSDHQPGGCETYEEAERKLRRVLDGDEAFIADLRASQRGLLRTFRPEYVRERWERDFLGNVMRVARVPDVRAFADWKQADANRFISQEGVSLSPGRSVGLYTYTVPGGGIYKYIIGLLEAAARLAVPHDWSFHLMWDLPTRFPIYPMPAWEGEAPANLRISAIPVAQPAEVTLISESGTAPQPPPPARVRWLRGTGRIVRWRRSPLYLRNRVLRVASEMVILPAQYLRDVVLQRTVRPHVPGLRITLEQARLGRRFLHSRLGAALIPEDRSAHQITRTVVNADGSVTVVTESVPDRFFLSTPPPPPAPPLLPELDPAEFRPYLQFSDLEALTRQHDVIYLPNPFRLISPNTPLEQVHELPVVVTMHDLAHEITEVWGDNTDSISREMVLWGRIARKIVFSSAWVRDEAIRRYGIAEEKTCVVRTQPLVLRRDRPGDDEIAEVRRRLGLPERYLLNTGHQGTHKNNLAIFKALKVLRWRGYPLPPLVLGGVDSKKLLTGPPFGAYLTMVQQFIRENDLRFGRDLIVLDEISERDLPAVYAGSCVNISMTRSEACLHGMISESMLYQTPVIASAIPVNIEELSLVPEARDCVLLVPPDDPVALADAIQHTLDNPDLTAQRVQRAHAFIRPRTWEATADHFLRIFEQAAANPPLATP
jgi:glycosyltransferase involved in cell wall biosynthesis